MSGTATLKMHTKLAFGENPASVVRLTLIFTIANGGMVSRLQSSLYLNARNGLLSNKRSIGLGSSLVCAAG